MKQLLMIMLSLLSLTACGNPNTKTADKANVEKTAQKADEPTVYVYYFHGKQRCKTCITVEDVAKSTIKNAYAGNPKVRFTEVKNYETGNASLVEKYGAMWNALIIAKGNDHIEITKQAFANAVNNPEALKELIKTEVDKRLAE